MGVKVRIQREDELAYLVAQSFTELFATLTSIGSSKDKFRLANGHEDEVRSSNSYDSSEAKGPRLFVSQLKNSIELKSSSQYTRISELGRSSLETIRLLGASLYC